MKKEKRDYREWKRRLKTASEKPAVPCASWSGIIVFNTETTGPDPFGGHDEILQISIIDVEGNVLLNSYVKPRWHESWPEAEAVHGITPEMVADAPSPEDIIPIVKGIFEAAKILIAYNIRFDLAFLSMWGIRPVKGQQLVDVMREFAEAYRERNDSFGPFKWYKLETAARCCWYELKGHDSLESVRATLHVYEEICRADH